MAVQLPRPLCASCVFCSRRPRGVPASRHVSVYRQSQDALPALLAMLRLLWTQEQAFFLCIQQAWAAPVALVVKNPPAGAGDVRDSGSIPGWGRHPGEGNGNPLQCSCLENAMDREAWWAAVHGVAHSPTGLKRLGSGSSNTKWQMISDTSRKVSCELNKDRTLKGSFP